MALIETTDTQTTRCATPWSLSVPPGWWLLPSVLGGLYLWCQIIAACLS